MPDETVAAECPVCQHTAPPTCVQCGGVNGYPGGAIPPCQSCKLRGGGVPTTEPPPVIHPAAPQPPTPDYS